jgi:hypothetical protein
MPLPSGEDLRFPRRTQFINVASVVLEVKCYVGYYTPRRTKMYLKKHRRLLLPERCPSVVAGALAPPRRDPSAVIQIQQIITLLHLMLDELA